MRESRLSMITNRPETSDPVDFSFLFLSNMKDLQEVQPRESVHVKKRSDGKYNTASIRVSNNFQHYQLSKSTKTKPKTTRYSHLLTCKKRKRHKKIALLFFFVFSEKSYL